MKTAKALLFLTVLALSARQLTASGNVGIYAIIDKVEFEPNERSPQRIQIWGVFTFADAGVGSNGKTLTPQRGYLYFSLPCRELPPNDEIVLKEWSDLKAVAGTGQAVGFGLLGYIGRLDDSIIKGPNQDGYLLMQTCPENWSGATQNLVRPASAAPKGPQSYSVNVGVVKLSETGSMAAIVKQLRDALKK